MVGEDFLMRKWVMAILVGLSIGLVGETQGQAATWHRGTPKALRGVWTGKKTFMLGSYIHPTISFRQKFFDAGSEGDPAQYKRMSYRHRRGSHSYDLKGHEWFYSHYKTVGYFHVQVRSAGHGKRKVHFNCYRLLDHGHQIGGSRAYGAWFYK